MFRIIYRSFSNGTIPFFLSLLCFSFFLIGSACLSFGLYYGWYAKILWEMGIYGIVSPAQLSSVHCTASSFDVRSVALIQSCVTENIAYFSFLYFCMGSVLFFIFGILKTRNILKGFLIGVQASSGFLLLFTLLVYNGDRVYWNERVTQLQTDLLGIPPKALTNSELFVLSLVIFSFTTICFVGLLTYHRKRGYLSSE
jgi:hypothetical protein